MLQTGSGSSFALGFLGGEISPELASHLPDLWRKDIGPFSDAIRGRDLPPTVLEARAHESVAGFLPALKAITPPAELSSRPPPLGAARCRG